MGSVQHTLELQHELAAARAERRDGAAAAAHLGLELEAAAAAVALKLAK